MASLFRKLGRAASLADPQDDEAARDSAAVAAQGPPEVSAGELVKCFRSEAVALTVAFSASGDQAAAVSALGQVLGVWERRLASGAGEGPCDARSPALRAFLHSKALKTAIEALFESAHFGAVLRGAAAVLAELAEAPATGEGRLLAHLLLVASTAPPALLAELLLLLADANETTEKCQSGLLAQRGIAAEEDSRWVLRLLAATLTDGDEADALEVSCACGAIEDALAAAKSSLAQQPSEGHERRPALPRKLSAGTEVWASWPLDGRWYRAHVKSSSRRRVHVAWTPPPAGAAAGPEGEYVDAEAAEGCAAFAELGRSAVVPVAEAAERPAPALVDPPQERPWTGPLAAIEEADAHFRELWALCSRAEGLRRSGAATQAPAAAGPPLGGASGTLHAFRVEAEERAESLGCVAALAADEARGLQQGLHRSAGAAEAELQQLGTQHLEAAAAVEAARARHRELQQQLQEAAERLAAAEASLASLEAREERLATDGVRAAEDLAQRCQAAREHSDVSRQRQDVLTRAGTASQQVEAQLAARSTAAAGAASLREDFAGREQALRSTCVVSHRTQRRGLQELLARWQEGVWGPAAAGLARRPEQIAELRGAHERVLEIVDATLRTAEQAAAPSDRDKARPAGGAGVLESLFGHAESDDESDDDAVAECMSRVAPKYRRMQQQLARNLDRLAHLDAQAGGAGKAPCASPPFSLAAAQLASEEVVLFAGSPAA